MDNCYSPDEPLDTSNPPNPNRVKGYEYVDALAGFVPLPAYTKLTLMEFASQIKLLIQKEQEKINPDNEVIFILCEAAKLGWEQIEWANKKVN